LFRAIDLLVDLFVQSTPSGFFPDCICRKSFPKR
jgi:hypothetical protein